jgi:hypothetical protein
MDQFAKSDGCETFEWQRVGDTAAESVAGTNHLTDYKYTSAVISRQPYCNGEK